MHADTLPVGYRRRLQPSTVNRPPIDTDTLFARCRGNVAFALSLLVELEASGKRQVDDVARHVATGQLETAAEVAHSLKGGAAIIGAESLSEIAAEIESAARADKSPLLMKMVHDLCSEMDCCLTQIPTIRNATQQR